MSEVPVYCRVSGGSDFLHARKPCTTLTAGWGDRKELGYFDSDGEHHPPAPPETKPVRSHPPLTGVPHA